MKRVMKTNRILGAAVAAVVAMAAGQVHAQRQVDNGGALDANNRVGSGGVNMSGPAIITPSGNQIVTGNVTGGKQFRGGVPYTDPREFRGSTGGDSFGRFIAGSAGTAAPYQAPVSMEQARPFYDASRLAAPLPPEYREVGATGIYVPRATNPQDDYRGPFDTRLNIGPLNSQPLFGSDMLSGGPMMRGYGISPTELNASVLTGPGTGRNMDVADMGGAAGRTNWRNEMMLSRLGLDARSVQAMRDELNETGETGTTPQGGGTNLAKPLPQPFESPNNRVGGPQSMGQNLAGQPLAANVRTAPGVTFRVVEPGKQSTQYAELQQRLDRYYQTRMQDTGEQKYRDYIRQLQVKQEAERLAKDKAAQPDGMGQQPPIAAGPDYGKMSRELLTQVPRGAGVGVPGPAALRVESLSAGMREGGLKTLMTQAEQSMSEGKFLVAADQFKAAAEVAPNNPLIRLGEAHAALAAGYYRVAEAQLRRALRAEDPAPLMASYNLKIAPARMEQIVRDLKDTAQRQPNDAGLVILLAYLAYNNGSGEQAAMYLREAERRSGGKDELVKLMRLHWSLPAEAATPMDLRDIMKQIEAGNVLQMTLTDDSLYGQFRRPVMSEGGKVAVESFRTGLPPGAATGPLSKWITDNSQGAKVTIDAAPTTRPAGPTTQPDRR